MVALMIPLITLLVGFVLKTEEFTKEFKGGILSVAVLLGVVYIVFRFIIG